MMIDAGADLGRVDGLLAEPLKTVMSPPDDEMASDDPWEGVQGEIDVLLAMLDVEKLESPRPRGITLHLHSHGWIIVRASRKQAHHPLVC